MARKATGQVCERKTRRGKVFALRFRAYGERQYVTLGGERDGWTRVSAEDELANVLADVRRGIWRAPAREPAEATERREPTFHEFATDYMDARRHALRERTVEDYEWALSCHLLPFFKDHRLSEITPAEVDRYRAAKLRERELSLVKRPLSNGSINKTLTRLSQILEIAVEYSYVDRNAARGKRRRLKAAPPRRASLAADQVKAVLDAASSPCHRALLATAIMAGGLRVSELTALRRRDVDLAATQLRVEDSKTPTGIREVALPPELRDELAAYLAGVELAPDDFLFPGRGGRRRDRNAVRNRVLYPAITRANVALADRELPTISPDANFHSLRRTYASLCAEARIDPAWTAAQIGHRSSRFTLDVYTDVGNRRRNPAEQLGALIRGEDQAPMGTGAQSTRPEATDPRGDEPAHSAV